MLQILASEIWSAISSLRLLLFFYDCNTFFGTIPITSIGTICFLTESVSSLISANLGLHNGVTAGDLSPLWAIDGWQISKKKPFMSN